MQTTSQTPEVAYAIGELCVGGDWACARSDLATLASIARQLGDYTAEPLHCELAQLAELCHTDETRATARWSQLKDRVYRQVT